MATEKYNVPTLGKENHESWFLQQQVKLEGKQVFYTCEQTLRSYAGVATIGTIAQGLEELSITNSESGQVKEIRINIEKRDKFMADQAVAISLLFRSLTPDDQSLYLEYKTAYEFWSYLKKKYSQIDETSADKYMTKIQNFSYNQEDGIKASWDKLKLYRRKLISADPDTKDAYKDKGLLKVLIRSLPRTEYKATTDSLRVQVGLSVEAKLKLLEEKESELQDEQEEKAHAAFKKGKSKESHNRQSSGSSGDYRNRKCYLCDGNHTVRDCKYLEGARNDVALLRGSNRKTNKLPSPKFNIKRSSAKKTEKTSKGSSHKKPKAYAAETRLSEERSTTSDEEATVIDESDEHVHLSGEEIRKATPSTWVCDSAATSHMSDQTKLFRSMKKIPRRSIKVGGGVIYSNHIGEVDMVCDDGSSTVLANVLYVPKLGVNLLSGRRVCGKGMEAGYDEISHWFKSKESGRIILKAEIRNGLYIVTHVAKRRREVALSSAIFQAKDDAIEVAAIGNEKLNESINHEARYQLMHRRFNHLGPDKIRNLHKVTTISPPIKIPSVREVCEVCTLTKMTNRIPTTLSDHKDETLKLIQFDIAGPFPKTIRGNRYFLLIIDSFTRKNWIIPLKQKSDAIGALKSWKQDVELESSQKVRAARTDNAPELLKAVGDWRSEGAGTRLEQTTAASSHQNGPAERNIRTAEADMRAMLKEASLPLEFWDEAVEHDAYVRNRTDTGPVIQGSVVSPQEAYTGKTPSIDHIRVWGTKAYAYIHPKTVPAGQRHDKLRDTAREGVFMGCIDSTTKHFKVYCPELGYTQRFSRVVVDENVKGGSIDLRLRGETGPSGTANIQPDRQPRGRPKRVTSQDPISETTPAIVRPSRQLRDTPSRVILQDPLIEVAESLEPRLVPQVIINPVVHQPGIKVPYFNEKHERVPSGDKEKHDQVDPAQGTSTDKAEEHIPNLDPIMADESDNLRSSTIDQNSVLEVQEDTNNRHITRSHNKRKRGFSEEEDARLNKIVKAMIAQVPPATSTSEHAFPATEVCGIPIPLTYKEAVNHPRYGDQWKEAIKEELASLMDNGTWEMVVPPNGTNIVTSKWVFTIKPTSSGEVERFKARLVARGFSQVKGEDYHETFAPTVRQDTLRLFLSIAAIKDLECRQYDIKNAFTESYLKEKIYMAVPEGLDVKKGQVLKIMRSLYGLKQAARDWNLLLKRKLLEWGFKQSLADPCVFVHPENSVKIIVYVDDIVGIAKSKGELDWFYEKLSNRFKAKDLGNIHKILGVRVTRDRKHRTITLDQEQYLRTVLNKFGFAEPTHKTKDCPSTDYLDYAPTTDSDTRIDANEYQQVIGSLMYAMILTRPDIAFAIGKLSQSMSNPCERHGRGLKKLMRYLNSTITYKLAYGGDKSVSHIQVYSDADWASDKTDRKSVSGFTIMFYGGPISWGSKKQRSVATSSCESEYMALSMCAKQGQWIAQILKDLEFEKYISKNKRSVQMLGDNQGALALVKNPHLHERSKHIDICYHFIRDLHEKGRLDVSYVSTRDMVADGMTKALQKPAFIRFKDLLGMLA